MAPPLKRTRVDVLGDGDGVDRLSVLSDDVLLKVLARLGCAREAVRTGVLSSRWSCLWTLLSECTFKDMEPEAVEAALSKFTRPSLDRLDITADAANKSQAATLLRAAAHLAPETFSARLCWSQSSAEERSATIELPCFNRTSFLALTTPTLAPPSSGEFTRLETLELAAGRDIFAALLPNCPRLRVLRIHAKLELEAVTVHSRTLEELAVKRAEILFLGAIRRIDIDAPELKEAKLDVDMDQEFDVVFSAPNVLKLDWNYSSTLVRSFGWEYWGCMLCSFRQRYSLSDGVRALELSVICMMLEYTSPDPDDPFAQDIARLPVADFSVLRLNIDTDGHAYGPLLMDLLQIRPAIKSLSLAIDPRKNETCTPSCPCQQHTNWKSEYISLTDLKEVDVTFSGTGRDDDVDFLKLLFRCAPGLKRMNVGVCGEVYDEICSICAQNSHVKCEIILSPNIWFI